jgi:hypothetical protein
VRDCHPTVPIMLSPAERKEDRALLHSGLVRTDGQRGVRSLCRPVHKTLHEFLHAENLFAQLRAASNSGVQVILRQHVQTLKDESRFVLLIVMDFLQPSLQKVLIKHIGQLFWKTYIWETKHALQLADLDKSDNRRAHFGADLCLELLKASQNTNTLTELFLSTLTRRGLSLSFTGCWWRASRAFWQPCDGPVPL